MLSAIAAKALFSLKPECVEPKSTALTIDDLALALQLINP